MTVFNLDTTSGSLQTVKVNRSGNEVTTSADVVHLAAAISDSRPVMWAYIYPGWFCLFLVICPSLSDNLSVKTHLFQSAFNDP